MKTHFAAIGITWVAEFDMDVVKMFKRLFTSFAGPRFAAALLPLLFGTSPRSHHKGATGRIRTGDQQLPVLFHCRLG